MEVPPILETNRIHCFYRETYDLNLLPLNAPQVGLIRTKMPNIDICVGESNTYEELIKKYDKSVKFTDLRNSWVTGKKVPLGDIIVTVEEKKRGDHEIVTSDDTERSICRYHKQLKELEKKKEKLQSNNGTLWQIQRIDRNINYIRQTLQNITSSENKHTANRVYSQNQIVLDDEEDEEDEEVPSRQFTAVSTETKELSDAREALSAERMGSNRSDIVQRLRATVNQLENTNALPRQVIEESIALARPIDEVTEDNVFDHLQLLQWRDKDEFKMTVSQLNKIPIQTLNEMYPVMQNLAINLRTALAAQTGAIEAMSDEDRNNFLFHVMAKGKELYYQSLCDADFCIYMLDTWQPLYSFIRKKLGRDD